MQSLRQTDDVIQLEIGRDVIGCRTHRVGNRRDIGSEHLVRNRGKHHALIRCAHEVGCSRRFNVAVARTADDECMLAIECLPTSRYVTARIFVVDLQWHFDLDATDGIDNRRQAVHVDFGIMRDVHTGKL